MIILCISNSTNRVSLLLIMLLKNVNAIPKKTRFNCHDYYNKIHWLHERNLVLKYKRICLYLSMKFCRQNGILNFKLQTFINTCTRSVCIVASYHLRLTKINEHTLALKNPETSLNSIWIENLSVVEQCH